MKEKKALKVPVHRLKNSYRKKLYIPEDVANAKLIVESFIKEVRGMTEQKMPGGWEIFKEKNPDIKPDSLVNKKIDHTFSEHTLDQVLDAILNKEIIDNVDISVEVRNPEYRFIIQSDADISFKISQVIGQQNRNSNIAPEVSAMGRDKIKSNADKFAIEMYDIVQQIQREEKISTYRETIDALNKNEIPTRNGGTWQLQTLQNLKNRWKVLGLTPPKPDQP